MDKQQVLQDCTVHGFIVKLPDLQLERDLYLDVKKALELIGGKWKGGKTQGFEFREDPTPLLTQVANGKRRDIKKEFQFFGTPDKLGDEMVEDLRIEEYDMLLEPHGGQGALIKAVHRRFPKMLVHYCELMPLNRTFLEKLPNVQYVTDNFLKLGRSRLLGTFHKIIANPPFTKNQDIDHIRLMYDLLAENGRIVTIASKHWQYVAGKKELEFKNWLDSVDSEVQDVPAGTFSESGTSIATVKIIINK